ncbi:MAG: glycine zipper family protein [Kiloniellales bacterium]|nr:glycine zipper family protein [Kiloniellales bacterium]
MLYPNAHLERVGKATAERDIDECRARAEAYGASARDGAAGKVAGSTAIGGGGGAAVGAAGGAVLGRAGRGAAVGAATGATGGFLRGLFRSREPSQIHKRFVDTCLRDLGYEPIGWD